MAGSRPMIWPPWTSLPTCTTSKPWASTGEAAVPQNNFDESTVEEKSFCQRCLPVAVSHAVRMPVTPKVFAEPHTARSTRSTRASFDGGAPLVIRFAVASRMLFMGSDTPRCLTRNLREIADSNTSAKSAVEVCSCRDGLGTRCALTCVERAV